MRSSAVVTEYLELWDQVLAQSDEYLPHVIDAGLASQTKKMDMDSIDLIVSKQRDLAVLRQELQNLDRHYNEVLSLLRFEGNKGDQEFTRGQITQTDGASRIADFLQGLVLKLNRDFTKSPELLYILQQLYIFQNMNMDSCD